MNEIEVNSLSALEAKASTHLETWKQAYWEFWTVLLAIRDTGAWEQSQHDTWEGYLTSRWLPQLEVSYTRIRQIQAAYPIMQAIQSVTGVTLNEHQVRNAKSVVPSEKAHLLPEVVSLAHKHTAAPSKRHYKAAYDVLAEREAANTVTIAGESRALSVIDYATKEAIEEADRRFAEHRTSGLIDAPVRIRQIGNELVATIQLPHDYPVALLQDWIVKVRKPVMEAVA